MRTVWARRLSWLAPAALALAALAAGCGGSGSSSSSSTAAAQVAPAANTTTTKSKTEPAQPIHLRIVSPKPGAHTGQTLTVQVRLTGTRAAHPRFHYVLGSVKRSAGAKITFHGVAAGRHDLSVTLASDRHVHISEVVIVRAPPPPATPATTSQAPAPTTTSSPTPAPAPTPPPTTTKSAPPPPPPTTTKTSPPASRGIPQGNGGDADGDNKGGPSDGDGLI
ncbi:MAG: hypothetical protein ACXVUL_09880 [Solirubrobacteraceae bacterium]